MPTGGPPINPISTLNPKAAVLTASRFLDPTMNSTIDDTDSHASYSVDPAWNTGVWAQQNPQPLFGTNHGTPNPGATASFTFNGTAIYVYGYKWSDHGYRDISIDGQSAIRCDGRTGAQGSRSLVYWADGLTQGVHEITFRHTGTQGQYLNLDYFIVTSEGDPAPSGGSTADYPTSTGGAPTGGGSGSNSNKSNTTAIIIGVVVGVVLVVLALLLLWFWRRRRAYKRNSPQHYRGSEKIQATSPASPRAHEATPFILPPSSVATTHNPVRQSQPADKPTVGTFTESAHNQSYARHHPTAPSSSYYPTSDTASASGYSPPPTAYSPPPSQYHASFLTPAPGPNPVVTTNNNSAGLGRAPTRYMPDPNNPHPWASSSSVTQSVISSSVNQGGAPSGGAPSGGAPSNAGGDPSISKAQFSGASTSGGSTSAAQPVRSPSLEPPPQYTL